MASKVFDACVVAQSVVQGAIEPSRLWRSSNSRKLRYEVMGSPEEITNRIAAAVSSLDNVCPNLISGNPMRFRLSKHENGKCVSMLVRTPYWLDKVTSARPRTILRQPPFFEIADTPTTHAWSGHHDRSLPLCLVPLDTAGNV